MTKNPQTPVAPEPATPQNVALPPIDATPEEIARALVRTPPPRKQPEDSSEACSEEAHAETA